MNLYLVERTDPVGYDEYDSDVVAAADEERAKALSHVGRCREVEVRLIGLADVSVSEGVILASFNAG